MQPTYFLKTQNWVAEGTYYDKTGRSHPLRGEVAIVKAEEEWSLGGFMEVLFDPPVRFTNNDTIWATPLDDTLSWQSYNPALGTLQGTFEFIGDSMISFYRSKDGVSRGTETLMLREDGSYDNARVSFAGNCACRLGRERCARRKPSTSRPPPRQRPACTARPHDRAKASPPRALIFPPPHCPVAPLPLQGGTFAAGTAPPRPQARPAQAGLSERPCEERSAQCPARPDAQASEPSK